MSFKNEEKPPITPRELVFLLASAGYLDAQAAKFAQKLNKDRYIHHSFAVLDSVSSTYSMFRYFFEVFISNNNDLDLMRQVMNSPEGIAGITAEALFLISFSFLASYFKNETDKKNLIKASIVMAWPYFRDVMKGMKNAYKGWKSAAQIIGVLGGMDLRFLFIPVGLALGILASANRIWVRSMDDKRKNMMRKNAELFKSIQKLSALTKDEYATYFDLKKIHYQTDQERVLAYFAKAFGGLIDSLYLYAGLISLAILCPPAFIAMSVISGLYTVTCIIARLYDEYDEQLKLKASQTRCELGLVSKQLEHTYSALVALQDKSKISDEGSLEISRLKKEVISLIENFERLNQLLKKRTTYSYATATFFGLRQGLFAYGVLASLLFMITSIFFITAAVFPPVLLMVCIASGLVSILAVAAYTTRTHYLDLQKQKKEENTSLNLLINIKNDIKKNIDNKLLSTEHFQTALKEETDPPVPGPFYFQDWLEVFRSLFAGLSKGSNVTNFLGIWVQNMDSDGHDRTSSVIFGFKVIIMAVFGIVLSLRALARGEDLIQYHNTVKVSFEPKKQRKSDESIDDPRVSPTENSPQPSPRSSITDGPGFFSNSKNKNRPSNVDDPDDPSQGTVLGLN